MLLLFLAVADPLPPLAPLVEDEPVATTTASAAAPPPSSPSPGLAPLAIAADLGLDLPGDGRLPMASTRIAVGTQWRLGDAATGFVGLRSGYSYAAGEGAVVDDVFGLDANAFLMAHRVPIRAAGALSILPAPDAAPLSLSLDASAGADVVIVQSHSFGRTVSSTVVAPAASLGGRIGWQLSPLFAIGLFGEADLAVVDEAALAPGLSPDVGAVRVGISSVFSLGG